MKNALSNPARLCVASLMLALIGLTLVSAYAQEAPRGSLGGEIHEAVAAAGIKVVTVTCNDGQYQVVLDPAHSGRQGEANQIRDQIVNAPPAVIVVDNLQDALVVLRFEPFNASANQLVKARYETLRAAARGQ